MEKTHRFQKKLLKNSAAPIIIIGDSIATGLRRYRHIWRNYFKDALNLGIGGDRVENVLWRARDISLPHTTLFVIIHCGTNNVDQSQPEDIAVGVMKIAETFMKNHPKITTIITGMLPRDKTYSFRQAKIDETNKILKAKCKNLPQTYFMDQDDDWVKSDLILDKSLYYKDFLHLGVFKAVFNRIQTSIIIITIIFGSINALITFTITIITTPLPSSLVSSPPSDLLLA